MVSRRHLPAISLLALLLCAPQQCGSRSRNQELAAFIQLHIIENALVIFEPVAILFPVYYGYRMVLDSDNDNALGDAAKSFIYVLIGFGIIALTGSIALSPANVESVTDFRKRRRHRSAAAVHFHCSRRRFRWCSPFPGCASSRRRGEAARS